jgi:hypothetical protein
MAITILSAHVATKTVQHLLGMPSAIFTAVTQHRYRNTNAVLQFLQWGTEITQRKSDASHSVIIINCSRAHSWALGAISVS